LDNHQKLRFFTSSMREKYNDLTGPIRVNPDFLIIGAKKAGTTSLYRNLIHHPEVEPCLTKETDFFNRYYSKGINWYRSHFPIKWFKQYAMNQGRNFITGEATPTYIYYPHAPKRIKKLIPNIKLIVILRNPVHRSFSHYNMSVRHGDENLTFEQAIDSEDERIFDELEKMKIDQNYYSLKFQTYSYLHSSLYADQLEKWLENFSKKQFHFIQSENFNKDIQPTFDKVIEFLCLKPWNVEKYHKYQNAKNKILMNENMKNKLIDFFKPHNEKLFKLIGKRFDWDE